jgi:Ca2+-binding RTX toxin-like protein
MAYEIRLKFGMDGTGSSATFVGVGSDSIVLSGTGFKYDADGYLESGNITKMSYMDPSEGSDPVQSVTLKIDAAKLYDDVLQPAIALRHKIDDWSVTEDTLSATSNKIVLQTDDFGKVIVTGTNLAEDPTKGNVTSLELFDVNGNSIDKLSNLHVSLATALTALGESNDIYDYLTQGDNTITNSGFFPPRLEGGLGNDTLKGGDAAFPLAEYVHTAIAGIKADLGTGKVTGGAGTDKLIDIDGISGSNFNDTLTGRDDAKSSDTFYGNDGKDTINGLAGNDFISGGAQDDKLSGGDGDDILDGGAGNDVLDGGGGKHDVISFAGDSLEENGVTLRLDKTGVQDFGGWGKDTLKGFEGVYGSESGDQLFGSNGNNVMAGGSGADKIQGLGGNDTLYGDIVPGGVQSGSDTSDGDDILDGGIGNDTLYVGLGMDTLIGGAGKDSFVFRSPPDTVFEIDVADKIKDFKPQDDTISFNHFGFGDLPVGKLSSDAFVEGTEAKDAQDRIIYDKSTGHLYFDADGTGDTEQVLFATLTNKSDLTNADFVGF